MVVDECFSHDLLLLEEVVLGNSVAATPRQALSGLVEHLKQLGVVDLRNGLLGVVAALGPPIVLHLHRLIAPANRLSFLFVALPHRDQF